MDDFAIAFSLRVDDKQHRPILDCADQPPSFFLSVVVEVDQGIGVVKGRLDCLKLNPMPDRVDFRLRWVPLETAHSEYSNRLEYSTIRTARIDQLKIYLR